MGRTTTALLMAPLMVMATGCSTLERYGVGGPPRLMCDTAGRALIDDRLLGPDTARVSVVRRFYDADALCARDAEGVRS